MAFGRSIRGGLSELYVGRSNLFKSFLIGGVMLISALFTWYTLGLIEQLQLDTRDQVDKYVRLWQLAANSESSGDVLPFIFDEIILKATIPMVVLDKNREPVVWRNIPDISPDDTTRATFERLKQVADDMYRHNKEYPLYFDSTIINYLRYGDSEVIKELKVMPFVAIGIVLAFLIVTVIGFQNIRRSEERYIWVGMAKETAHQLGTPITSLMGWLDLLPAEVEEGLQRPGMESSVQETIANMKHDVERLERVANRFGKIGSAPELKAGDLNRLVRDTVDYYQRRAPFEGHGVKIEFAPGEIGAVSFSYDLMGWVLENMIKNAMQAVDSRTGRIDVASMLNDSGDKAIIRITDNGHGISPAAARKIFRAGFTTKKRGWGLGLTLVKRIIEEYHGGRVYLKRSKPGETVFEIILPKIGQLDSADSIKETV